MTDFNKKHKNESFKPFNFACILKMSKAQLHEKAFRVSTKGITCHRPCICTYFVKHILFEYFKIGISHVFFLILTQDYKGGNVSSDVSGLEPAFRPLN